MIKLYKEIDKALSIIDVEENEYALDKLTEDMWVHMIKPTVEDISIVANKTGIPRELLQRALDEEERAHLDFDNDATLIVLDIPIVENDFYTTLPFAMVYNAKYFVTICTRETDIDKSIIQRFKKIEPHKHIRFSLQIMHKIATMYISSLKIIDAKSKEIQTELRSSMRNQELFNLMELNKSLVYFSTSLNSNKIVLGKLTRIEEYNKYETDFDLMEDVGIENNQAIEMCSIYRDILAGMMDAFASIISNNLNIVMKVLAVITLVISIPTLIASLWGMNVNVPFTDSSAGFYIIIAISIILSIFGAFILMRLTKSKRKVK
ncbi:MAG: magnesium transporter CorA family protein [Anaeroplasmataceae bacterium]